MKTVKRTADQLKTLLRKKHIEDVFVSECKTGPSPCPRLDAWAMIKSWRHPCAIGYEIKVDRSDFLNDQKWPDYLPFCNEFYFVCPSKLITKEEVGPEIGLIWASDSGTMLYTKKKAARRTVTIPSELYEYLLMARTQIIVDGDYGIPSQRNNEYYREWFETSESNKKLGHEVAHKIQRLVAAQVGDVQKQNKELSVHIDKLAAAERVLKELGINVDQVYVGNLKKTINNVLNGIPENFESAAKNAHDFLGRFLNQVKELRNENSGY